MSPAARQIVATSPAGVSQQKIEPGSGQGLLNRGVHRYNSFKQLRVGRFLEPISQPVVA